MPGKVAGLLIAAIIPPSIAAGMWQHLIAEYPAVAAVLLLGYEGVLTLAALSWKILEELGKRWQERIVNRADRALGRRISRFDRRYRDSVLGSLRFIDLKGLATIGFYTPELDEVFVDVSLTYRAPHQVQESVLTSLPADVTDRHSIGEFLDKRKPIVLAIVGAPGSGKTTLLRRTARQICQARRGRQHRVPIMLYLRDHVSSIIAIPQVTLPDLVRDTLERGINEPTGWFEQKLYDGSCVVLLDGLDEVARQDDRRAVADWVELQIEQYPLNDYVITSRPQGYLSAPVNGATVLQVRNFTDDQVIRFIRGWYLAVEKHSTGTADADVRFRAETAAEDLLSRLNNAPGLYDLTINPLLLTMIANVHRYRGALPGSRARLYSEICQVMLWRRQEAKDLPVELGGDEKEVLLRKLAFTMMERRVGDLPRTAIFSEIEPILCRMSTALSPEGYLADVSSNGLLIERESGLYSFAHHTFQEYLAAIYIREQARSEVLANAVDDVWWREATLLYAAGSDADPIVEACLASESVTALSLAFDCAEQGSQLAPELRGRLDDLLGSAFSPNADSERQRLIASVLAARHLCHLVRTSNGGRVCTRPITAGIYWLYQQDTGAPAPDSSTQFEPGPGQFDPEEPILGLRAEDAVAFVFWINSVTGNDPGYRLPKRAEAEDPAVSRSISTVQPLERSPRDIWIEADSGHGKPQLWLPAGGPHPHTTDAGTLVRHVDDDLRRSLPTIIRLLLLRAIVTVRVLSQGLDLVSVLDMAFDHVLDHAFDLDRGLTHVRALNPAFGREQATAFVLVHDLGQELRHYRGRDRARDRTIEIANNIARTLASALENEGESGRTRTIDLALPVDRVLDDSLDDSLALDHAFDRALDRVMGTALSYALARVLRQNTPPDSWIAEFSRAFAEHTRIGRAGYVVSPDSMVARVESARTAFIQLLGASDETTSSSWAYGIAHDLARTALPILERQHPLTADSSTDLRLTALCLAAEADARNAVDLGRAFREIAAGVTLLERRVTGQSVPTETVILATA